MTPDQIHLIEKTTGLGNSGNTSASIIMNGTTDAISGDYARISTTLITIQSGRNCFWIDIGQISSIVVSQDR